MKHLDLQTDFLIAIPSYNCGPQIRRVLSGLESEKLGSMNVWVVDNGSSDSTVEEALAAKRYLPQLRVFVNTKNINLGGSHKVIFPEAQALGFSHVFILHGDDQASPTDIKGMFELSRNNGGISVLGARFMKESILQGYDWKRIFGNKILNLVFSVCARRRLYDLGSGLNLFRLVDLEPQTYVNFGNTITFNYQLILDLIRRNVSFIFSPISWKEEDQVSNARNVYVFMAGIKILVAWMFRVKNRTSQLQDMPRTWNEKLS